MSEVKTGDTFKGLILGYLRSGSRSYPGIVLVKLLGGAKADNVIGCKMLFVDSYGNKYVGRIIGVHGSKGVVIKVRFKPNIPAQLFNSTITIACSRGGSSV